MNDYIKLSVTITPAGDDAADLLAQLLADEGFESFVTTEQGLEAYAPLKLFDQEATDAILAGFPMDVKLSARSERVEGRDWNAEWERNYFQPIVVGRRCVIHSSFHTDVPHAEFDITIDPKLAFGTGHHATTCLMIRRLLDAPLQGRSLIDMGTGSGILAILAAMRGASVEAIEIDEFACVNAAENVEINNVQPSVRLTCGDASALAPLPPADFFLANINRNIILADLETYAAHLKPGGEMYLSGFYAEPDNDLPLIRREALRVGLTPLDVTEQDRWACLRLRREH